MKTEYSVTHVSIKLSCHYEGFTHALELSLGKLNVAALSKAGHDPVATEKEIKNMQGFEGMTLFNVEDVGLLLSLNGPTRKAKRYFVGNYERASQIISMDLRLALYAPLRVLVYEAQDKQVHVEYELPSSLFSRLNTELITKSGLSLDVKLSNLISQAAKMVDEETSEAN